MKNCSWRCAAAIESHPFFHDIDWDVVRARGLKPLFVPSVESDTDITNFDQTFTNAPAVMTPPAESEMVRA